MVFAELPGLAHPIHGSSLAESKNDALIGLRFNKLTSNLSDSFASQGRRQQFGNRGSNTLRGQPGDDVLKGRAGNDVLRGFAGNDQLYGEAGNDQLWGGAGNDFLSGGTGSNKLYGEAGNDQLLGGKQADQLVGGLGDDKLTGGGGRDQITGGSGRDRFGLAMNMEQVQLSNVAQITDFKNREDFLELAEPLKFEDLSITQGKGQQAGDTLIQNKATGEYLVILKNVKSTNVDAADFWSLSPAPNPDPNPQPGTNPTIPTIPIIPATAAIQSSTVKFAASDTEAAIAATGAARIQLGTQTLYIGTQQVSSTNQNPLIASFDNSNPSNRWIRTDYEVTGTDGRGYGLFWSGSQLYGVFSVDGTQGTPDQDFRRVSSGATQSWLQSYGSGGGAKVAVLARLNPQTGEMTDAAYLSAILSNGKSNSLAVTNLSTNAVGNLVINAQSYYAPRRPDGKAMTQLTSESSPFDYTLEITPDLKTVVSTSAVGWS